MKEQPNEIEGIKVTDQVKYLGLIRLFYNSKTKNYGKCTKNSQ